MLRSVDRLVGGVYAIAAGLGVYVVYQTLKKHGVKFDQIYMDKYCNQDLYEQEGSCACGALKFLVYAPKSIQAFDDSNIISCKKGRYPVLIVPVSYMRMHSQNNQAVAIYIPSANNERSCNDNSKHIFCKICGVHIFHVESNDMEYIAINVYCLDDLSNLQVIYIPQGGQSILTRVQNSTSYFQQSQLMKVKPSTNVSSNTPNMNSEYEQQLLDWTKLQHLERDCKNVSENSSESTQCTEDDLHFNSNASVHSETSSMTSDHQLSMHSVNDLISMKHQLQYYLQRHMKNSQIDSNMTNNPCV